MSQICLTCITDEHLRARLEGILQKATCSFCDKGPYSVSLEQLATTVEQVLRKCLQVADSSPVMYDDAGHYELEPGGG
jgi:hypothetical protein